MVVLTAILLVILRTSVMISTPMHTPLPTREVMTPMRLLTQTPMTIWVRIAREPGPPGLVLTARRTQRQEVHGRTRRRTPATLGREPVTTPHLMDRATLAVDVATEPARHIPMHPDKRRGTDSIVRKGRMRGVTNVLRLGIRAVRRLIQRHRTNPRLPTIHDRKEPPAGVTTTERHGPNRCHHHHPHHPRRIPFVHNQRTHPPSHHDGSDLHSSIKRRTGSPLLITCWSRSVRVLQATPSRSPSTSSKTVLCPRPASGARHARR